MDKFTPALSRLCLFQRSCTALDGLTLLFRVFVLLVEKPSVLGGSILLIVTGMCFLLCPLSRFDYFVKPLKTDWLVYTSHQEYQPIVNLKRK
jgi:hypothetical protein